MPISPCASPHSELVLCQRLWPLMPLPLPPIMPLPPKLLKCSKWLVTPLSHCKASSLRNIDDSPFAGTTLIHGPCLHADWETFTKGWSLYQSIKMTQKKYHSLLRFLPESISFQSRNSRFHVRPIEEPPEDWKYKIARPWYFVVGRPIIHWTSWYLKGSKYNGGRGTLSKSI